MLWFIISLYALQCMLKFVTAKRYLHLTAVVSDEQDDHAKFQCWEMATPFATYPTVGDSISGLAEVDNISYVVLPPNSGEGIHKPPYPMFFVLLSGLARVTLPHGDNELYIMEGVNSLMVANDVRGEGHFTDYPSDKPSVALQIPFKDGQLPKHSVLHEGVCPPRKQVTRDSINDAGSAFRVQASARGVEVVNHV